MGVGVGSGSSQKLSSGDGVLDRLLTAGGAVVNKIIDFKNFEFQRDLALTGRASNAQKVSPARVTFAGGRGSVGSGAAGGLDLGPVLVIGGIGLAFVLLARS